MPTLLQFPDAATLCRVVADGVVPDDIATREVLVNPDDPLSLAVEEPLSRYTSKSLGELGVSRVGRNRLPEWSASPSWHHAAPLSTEAVGVEDRVLLKIPALAAAKWLAALGGHKPDRHIRLSGDLVWIDEPKIPQHLLSRAVDGEDGVAAHTLRAERVWVEIGKRHPFASRIACPEGRVAVVSGKTTPAYIDDWTGDSGPMFDLRKSSPTWKSVDPPETAVTPFRLKLIKAETDHPTLWVLPTKDLAAAVAEFDADRVEALLVCDCGDLAVVRVSKLAKQQPLQWFPRSAAAYVEARGAAGAYIPANRKLSPTIRRSVLLQTLDHDSSKVTWLAESLESAGRFTVNFVSADSFVPLSETVEHLSETAEQALPGHVISDPFPFQTFMVAQEESLDGEAAEKRPQQSPMKIAAKPPSPPPDEDVRKATAPRRPRTAAKSANPLTPSEAAIRRQELVTAFLAVDGPPDHPDRTAMWPELGGACAADGSGAETLDSVKCWIESVWHKTSEDDIPTAEDGRQPLPPGYAAIRSAVLGEPSASGSQSLIEDLTSHRNRLPVKGVWLAATAAFERSGDVLGLARFRDQLLHRLFEGGLDSAVDVPSFIRHGRSSTGIPASGDGLMRLQEPAFKWLPAQKLNRPYLDCLFAYAAAKSGDRLRANELIERSLAAVQPDFDRKNPSVDIVRRFVVGLFAHRIRQSLADDRSSGLPEDLAATFEEVRRQARGTKSELKRMYVDIEYTLQSLRQQSTILEPQVRADAIAVWVDPNGIRGELAKIVELPGPEIELWANRKLAASSSADDLEIARQLLPVAPRTSEKLTIALLGLAHGHLVRKGAEGGDAGTLIGRALTAAAHFGLRNHVDSFVEVLKTTVRSSGNNASVRMRVVEHGFGSVVKHLRRLGLFSAIETVISEVEGVLPNGLPSVPARCAIAAGRLVCGDPEGRGLAAVDEAKGLILSSGSGDHYYRGAAMTAYVRAAAWLPDAVSRYEELLTRVPTAAIDLVSAKSGYYAVNHLGVIEAMITSLVDHGEAKSDGLRQWLDQDEFLVRSRIHADFAAFRAKHGG